LLHEETMTNNRTLHVISHTHWDREWYQTFQQFRLRLVRMVDGLLELLEHDREFKHFMLDGQTIVLDDYLLMRPEKEAALRDYIRKGRIVIGPWHILPDVFLVGPEAHIRNLLEGDRTCRKFGPKMMIGYLPDPFGHPGQVPQILRGFGIDTACLWRGLDDQPAEFLWKSPDGSHVLMAYLRDSYSNGAGLPTEDLPAFAAAIAAQGDSLAAHSSTDQQLIMLGTDHMQPPPNTSEAIAYADEMLRGTHVIHSTLPAYVAAIQSAVRGKSLPVVEGELRSSKHSHLLPGVLSARMWIKQRNHACETLLTRWVEPFSTFAMQTFDRRPATMANQPPSTVLRPSSIVHAAWRLLMENHPHDSICGCSIDQVHDEMKIRFDQVDQIGEELTRQSLENLAASISTDGGSAAVDRLSSIVVFNPTTRARTDLAQAEVTLPAEASDIEIRDETGQVVPHETLGSSSAELINAAFNRGEFANLFASVHDGSVGNIAIRDLHWEQRGNTLSILAMVAENGAPNRRKWEEGAAAVRALLEDPAIRTIQVRARSLTALQVAFVAPEIPGMGWRSFHVHAVERAPETVHLSPLTRALLPIGMRLAQTGLGQRLMARPAKSRPPYRIANEFFTVEVVKDGTLNVLDKRTGARFAGLNRFIDGGDCGDEYNFSPPPVDALACPRLKSVTVTHGPVRQSLLIELELRAPASLAPDRQSRSNLKVPMRITTTVSLVAGVPRIDVHTTVDNTARDHRLRVHFPAPFAAACADHDGHFEVVRRPVGLAPYDESFVEQPRPEVPQRAFTDLSDGKLGLMIANRGLPEVEALRRPEGNAEIALTLLRCVGWLSRDDFSTRRGHAGPFLETPGAQMPGTWSFDYSVIPHAGGWENALHDGASFEVPLRSAVTAPHAGTLPGSGSFLSVEPASFILTCVKPTEDGQGWVARGVNTGSTGAEVTLRPWRPFKKAEQARLSEERTATLKAARDGVLTLTARGHEIVTVRFSD
jgi:alpha-mannosidase